LGIFRGAGLLPGIRPLFSARKHRPEGRRHEKFSSSVRTKQNPMRVVAQGNLESPVRIDNGQKRGIERLQ